MRSIRNLLEENPLKRNAVLPIMKFLNQMSSLLRNLGLLMPLCCQRAENIWAGPYYIHATLFSKCIQKNPGLIQRPGLKLLLTF